MCDLDAETLDALEIAARELDQDLDMLRRNAQHAGKLRPVSANPHAKDAAEASWAIYS